MQSADRLAEIKSRFFNLFPLFLIVQVSFILCLTWRKYERMEWYDEGLNFSDLVYITGILVSISFFIGIINFYFHVRPKIYIPLIGLAVNVIYFLILFGVFEGRTVVVLSSANGFSEYAELELMEDGTFTLIHVNVCQGCDEFTKRSSGWYETNGNSIKLFSDKAKCKFDPELQSAKLNLKNNPESDCNSDESGIYVYGPFTISKR